MHARSLARSHRPARTIVNPQAACSRDSGATVLVRRVERYTREHNFARTTRVTHARIYTATATATAATGNGDAIRVPRLLEPFARALLRVPKFFRPYRARARTYSRTDARNVPSVSRVFHGVYVATIISAGGDKFYASRFRATLPAGAAAQNAARYTLFPFF